MTQFRLDVVDGRDIESFSKEVARHRGAWGLESLFDLQRRQQY